MENKIVCAKCGGKGTYTMGYSTPTEVPCECKSSLYMVDASIINLLNEAADFITDNQTDETEDCSSIVRKLRAKAKQ